MVVDVTADILAVAPADIRAVEVASARLPIIDDELFDIRVIPRSRRNEVAGERAGRLLVRTTAAPVDGSANAAVLALLADHFGVRRAAITIVRGETSRDKTVRVARC